MFHKLAEEEREHLGTLEARYRELLQQDPQLESRPTFLFFKGAANGLFAAGADQLTKGVNDRQALMIGIRCERGSHKFFKRYGERSRIRKASGFFWNSPTRNASHLELLLRQDKALVKRQARLRRRAPGARRASR